MTIAYDAGYTSGNRIATVYGTNTFRFIPAFWSSKFIEALYNKTVFAEIANTDYQGEIRGMGDKVIIPLTPSITISDYAMGETLSYERPAVSTIELNIDKAKKFAFQTNDVEKLQAKPNYVAKFSEVAAEQMKVAMDSAILADIYNDFAAANTGATAGLYSNLDLGLVSGGTTDAHSIVIGQGSGTVDPFVMLAQLATVLDEQNTPESGRYVVIPPAYRMAMQASPTHQSLIQGSNEQMLRNGYIGQVDRFKVYLSNQLPTETYNGKTVTHIIAGHTMGLTFAAQMTQMETLRNPTDFGDLIRGLNVYGYKVVKPEVMTQATVRFAA